MYPGKISMPCFAIILCCILLPLINLIPEPIHESENELLEQAVTDAVKFTLLLPSQLLFA